MEYQVVFVTSNDKMEAKKIAKNLIENRLVACVNIIDSISSIYHWEGEIQEDTEYFLVAKTIKAQIEKIIQKVKTLHSYSCPEIISLPIQKGNPDYLKWVKDETE